MSLGTARVLAFVAAAVLTGSAQAPDSRWQLQPPKIERAVTVRSLAEAQAAVRQPGTKVILGADIDCEGKDGLILTADDLLIEGNGKTIARAKRGIASDNEVLRRIEIANVTLKQCDVGISLRRDQHVRVHHNIVVECAGYGMHFENSFGNHGRFFEVHHNQVTGGRQGCITFQDGCTDGRVYENVCKDGGYGPQSYANGCLNFDSNMIRIEVYKNRVEGGTFGLAVRGQNNSGMEQCVIRDNTIARAKQAGLRIGYFTFRNQFRDNSVKDCPVGVFYQVAYNVHSNFLDGLTLENCALPVQVAGAETGANANPRQAPDTHGNVDRVWLKDWKGGAPVLKVRGAVKGHTLADAGRWAEGAVVVEGEAKVLWGSYAHVIVEADGKPVAGADVSAGEKRATTNAEGLARLGPFPAVEITRNGARDIAEKTRLVAKLGGRHAEAHFMPDGSPARLTLSLK